MNEKIIDPNKAVDFILEKRFEYAKARAERIHLESFRHSKLALLMNQSTDDKVSAREQYARSHPEYIELLDELKKAVQIEEELWWGLEAARLRIDIWRSMEASARSDIKTFT